MSKQNLVQLGSNTAKAGFKNEDEIAKKFLNWKNDSDSQKWLQIMQYDLKEIEKVEVVKLTREKADIQVQIRIYLKQAISAENISIKLVKNKRGFNQIDKRKVDKYIEMWNIPEDVALILKLFTGEIISEQKNLKDKRRMFLNEMAQIQREKIINFFTKNKILIVSDIIMGRGKFSAGWMLVTLTIKDNSKWILKPISNVLQVFADGEVEITNRGSLKIGKITMQRKGGDGGRETAKLLQFKINPLLLFDN